jgi:hypothetical protein
MNKLRISAIRRAVTDRGLYNKHLISEKAINNPAGNAKIAVNAEALSDFDVRRAYMPIPFDGHGVAQMLGELGEVESNANRLSGNNPLMQGSHVRGNRNQMESRRMLGTSEGRFRMYALVFQHTCMANIKATFTRMMLEHPEALAYFDRVTGATITVKASELTNLDIEWDESDGLLPSAKEVPAEILQVLMQLVLGIPQLQQEYPIAALFELMARAGGFKEIGRLPRQQVQAQAPQQQQQQAQPQAAAPTPAA